MANLLQSSQTAATTAPAYYTDYLTNLASQGANVAGVGAGAAPLAAAQYVGPTDLQNAAFGSVADAGQSFQPAMQQAANTLTSAGAATSPLDAANPYLTAASGDLGTQATNLMSPYTQNVVDSIGTLGQRNIMQNLAPQATAGAVGSGQFGSKRGSEVLGQTIENANQDILANQRTALNTGYQNALTAAQQNLALQGTLGNTAGQLANVGQQNLTTLGDTQSKLGTAAQTANLADVNALSTLGGQQQLIAQNQQLFPLSNLSTLSGLLRGYTTPTTVNTTATGSPLSALSTIGAGAAGLFAGTGTGGTGPNIASQFTDWLKTQTGNSTTTPTNPYGPPVDPLYTPPVDTSVNNNPYDYTTTS